MPFALLSSILFSYFFFDQLSEPCICWDQFHLPFLTAFEGQNFPHHMRQPPLLLLRYAKPDSKSRPFSSLLRFDNYVGRFRVNAAGGIPTFPIDFCYMFHRTDGELPRTNNAVEGWHRGFQAHVSACHPVFWKFLEVLQKEETVVRVGILQNEGGHEPPPQRRRYVDCNQRILRIVDDFPNRQRIDYLRSIAHNLAY